MNYLEIVQNKIVELDRYKTSKEEINPKSNLFDDLYFDSLDIVELCLEFEKEFNIAIPDEYVSNWRTIQDIMNTLENHPDLKNKEK